MATNAALGEYELFASAARTVTATSESVRLQHPGDGASTGHSLVFLLDVTASSGGTELLDVVVNSVDPNGQVYQISAFTQATGVTKQRITVVTSADHVLQAVATIAGTTPSFTFSLFVLTNA